MTDMKIDMATSFKRMMNKCPSCNRRLVAGAWLAWCPRPEHSDVSMKVLRR